MIENNNNEINIYYDSAEKEEKNLDFIYFAINMYVKVFSVVIEPFYFEFFKYYLSILL